MTEQRYTDYRDRNPLWRCVDCNSSRNKTAGEKYGTCYDCGGKMSTAGDRTRDLDKAHAVDREWPRRGVCFDSGAEPYPPIIWTTVSGPRALAAMRADLAAIEKREQRLVAYRTFRVLQCPRYRCEWCGSVTRFQHTTVCANCGDLMKLI